MELSEILKGDLARLWVNYEPELYPTYPSPSSYVKIESADIDEEVYDFIVRLFSFWKASITASLSRHVAAAYVRQSPWSVKPDAANQSLPYSMNSNSIINRIKYIIIKQNGKA